MVLHLLTRANIYHLCKPTKKLSHLGMYLGFLISHGWKILGRIPSKAYVLFIHGPPTPTLYIGSVWVLCPAQVGMTLVIDHSGNVHKKKKPTIKDILVNREAWDSVEKRLKLFKHEAREFMGAPWPCEVVLATVEGLQGGCRVSAYVVQRAILQFYSECKLYPAGIVSELPSVQDWALKCGVAIKRLAPCLNLICNIYKLYII